jgi:hypothetical protein
MWPCEYASCLRMRTNKPQACVSTPWSLGNVYTAKALCYGGCQLREKTLTEKHWSSRIAGDWGGFGNPVRRTIRCEIRRKATVHTRLSSRWCWFSSIRRSCSWLSSCIFSSPPKCCGSQGGCGATLLRAAWREELTSLRSCRVPKSSPVARGPESQAPGPYSVPSPVSG